ncbi:MAG TPA: hypothetical protein VKA26_14270 [Ignavibacteriaceae bacterium]|nr:hypothetical protein [Ignavibacteriaceae bacterium]
MEQLTLSFGDHTSYKLKNTNWDFNFRPDQIKKANPDDKFVKLDREENNPHLKAQKGDFFIKTK